MTSTLHLAVYNKEVSDLATVVHRVLNQIKSNLGVTCKTHTDDKICKRTEHAENSNCLLQQLILLVVGQKNGNCNCVWKDALYDDWV